MGCGRKIGPFDCCSVVCGDCLELMKQLPDGCVDAVITDLPYGTTANKWDSVIPFSAMWQQFGRAAKQSAPFISTASQPFTSSLVMSKQEWFRHEWIWIKNRGSNFANTVREPMKEHESVLVFSRGKWTYNQQIQPRTGGGSDRVKYNVAFKTASENYREFQDRPDNKLPEIRVPSTWQKFNCEVGLHPTQKPVALMEYLIRTYTNPDDIVLDIACGSGSVGVAADRLSRHFLLFDIVAEYCETARRRLAKPQEVQPNLFDEARR